MVNSENCVCVNPSVTTFMIAAVNSLVLKWVSSLETFIRYMYVLMYVIDTPPSVYIHTCTVVCAHVCAHVRHRYTTLCVHTYTVYKCVYGSYSSRESICRTNL